jgi:hypothetical protein
MYFGAISEGRRLLSMLDDLADSVRAERSERDADPGDRREDPVEFAEEFLRNYTQGSGSTRSASG